MVWSVPNASLMLPDSIKTRIQAAEHDDEDSDGDNEDLSILGLVAQISKEEGLWGFYRGFGATMLNTFSMRTFVHLREQLLC